ncbi:MAG: enoyl-CoA hydratase-related protein, partial [Geminicoccaceae bacterium]
MGTLGVPRAEVLNALNGAAHLALAAALDRAGEPDVRAVVITGAGRGFCVGQDLSEFKDEA